MLLNRIDQYGKLGWLTVTVLAFWLAWPIGLLLLAYLVSSGRAEAWRGELRRFGGSFNLADLGLGGGFGRGGWAGSRGSGNRAFDDYRKHALEELEAEQREFQTFLEQLRAARDKEEFDAFMAQRRKRPNETSPAS